MGYWLLLALGTVSGMERMKSLGLKTLLCMLWLVPDCLPASHHQSRPLDGIITSPDPNLSPRSSFSVPSSPSLSALPNSYQTHPFLALNQPLQLP
jgi:hypothetical protein